MRIRLPLGSFFVLLLSFSRAAPPPKRAGLEIDLNQPPAAESDHEQVSPPREPSLSNAAVSKGQPIRRAFPFVLPPEASPPNQHWSSASWQQRFPGSVPSAMSMMSRAKASDARPQFAPCLSGTICGEAPRAPSGPVKSLDLAPARHADRLAPGEAPTVPRPPDGLPSSRLGGSISRLNAARSFLCAFCERDPNLGVARASGITRNSPNEKHYDMFLHSKDGRTLDPKDHLYKIQDPEDKLWKPAAPDGTIIDGSNEYHVPYIAPFRILKDGHVIKPRGTNYVKMPRMTDGGASSSGALPGNKGHKRKRPGQDA